MAYNKKKISPLDLYPSRAIGVKIPFSSNSVFTSVYTTKEQIKYNLINFILTDKRERPLNPRFGLSLRSKLFEMITDESTTAIEESMTSQIQSNFPNISVKSLSIVPDNDRNLINIAFSYSIKSTSEEDKAVVQIQNS